MERNQLFRYFVLAAFLLLFYQTLKVLSPFFAGILAALVLYLIFLPLHRLILDKMGETRANISAGISTFLVSIFIIIPLIFIVWLFIKELKTAYPVIKSVAETFQRWRQGEELIDIGWIKAIESKLQDILDLFDIDLQSVFSDTAETMVSSIIVFGKKLPRIGFDFVVNILVALFCLFFLFLDGTRFFTKVKELIPMEPKHKDQISNQLYLTMTAVIRGVFIIAAAQGALATLGLMIARVPSPIVLGAMTAFMSLIPVFGAPAVWIPIIFYYLFKGHIGQAVFLMLWKILLITMVDNFIRPLLIGSHARLPIIFLFFGLLGGIKVYGPTGLFLGPLVVALVIAFSRIFREIFSQESNEGGKL